MLGIVLQIKKYAGYESYKIFSHFFKFSFNSKLFWILSPRLPIKLGIVKILIELKSPLARTILANLITLKIIMSDFLYIHWTYIYNYDKD